MLLTALILATAVNPLQAGPIKLTHKFLKGEKDQYEVKSSLQEEIRQMGLETWLPQDLDINYKFTTEILDLQADGFAKMRYLRPNILEITGETAEKGPQTKTDKLDMNLLLTVSPINEIIDLKDESPKKKKPGGGEMLFTSAAARRQGSFVGQFVGEIQRLALFIGPLDSSMDFAPRLPLEDVKVGGTWQRTVGYQPQKLKGKEGKQAVQRLDYTYTYKGLVKSGEKMVYRVTADLNLDTDIGFFFNQMAETSAEESHLKSIPLKLKAAIDYDLDTATMRTVRAVALSEGGFEIVTTDTADPIVEMKLKGKTVMRLIGISGTGTTTARTARK